MFVITLKDQPQGIYSVFDTDEERIVPLFEQADDALRYVMQLSEDEENPDLQIMNVQPEQIIQACRVQGQKYSIITADDLIVPPDDVIKIIK
jgi:hypothetical protein|tara:strand:- start:52 stop:327 length:276 start_codon:yes stop_codon:yes gene_type:complete